MTAIFAYATNLGPHQMARHLRGQLSADQIVHINRRHITTEKLDAAMRDVKNCFSRYTLPRFLEPVCLAELSHRNEPIL